MPRIAYQADGAFALINLIGAGLGGAVLPASISSINVGENVVYRPIVGVTEHQEDTAVTKFLGIVRKDRFKADAGALD